MFIKTSFVFLMLVGFSVSSGVLFASCLQMKRRKRTFILQPLILGLQTEMRLPPPTPVIILLKIFFQASISGFWINSPKCKQVGTFFPKFDFWPFCCCWYFYNSRYKGVCGGFSQWCYCTKTTVFATHTQDFF